MRKRCFESERGLVVFFFALSVPSKTSLAQHLIFWQHHPFLSLLKSLLFCKIGETSN